MVACMVEMSFIEVSAESHFPIQNLPYGVFSTASNVRERVCVPKSPVLSECRSSRHTLQVGRVVLITVGSFLRSSPSFLAGVWLCETPADCFLFISMQVALDKGLGHFPVGHICLMENCDSISEVLARLMQD